MKKLLHFTIILLGLSASAQVGIGIPSSSIHPSAQLDVVSTTKGFLAPRMTEAQKNDIDNPAAGLLVYQTDGSNGFYYFDGLIWKSGLGPQGVAGIQGIPGVPGPQGERGIDGINGNPGPIGPQGEMGPQGVAGIDGEPGAPGPIGLQGEMGPQGLPGINGINGIDGATGPMGPQGPQGETGPQGIQGEMGPQGVAGINGLDGSSIPITVGAISSTSNSNGASINEGELNLAPADATNSGVVTTGEQTLAGNKTFDNNLQVNGFSNFRDAIFNGWMFEVNMPSWGPWGNSFRMDPMMGIDARADRFRFNGMYADFNSDLFVRGQVDMQQSLNVNGTTTSNSFIKNEGTSSQFLKADGTVDANTYATTSIVDTKEDAINKSTDVNLGTSDTLFPTQNATKTYVDAQIATTTPTFATGADGNDFNISTLGSAKTFNLPDASTLNRGVVTTGEQTLAGNKTFDNNLQVNGFSNFRDAIFNGWMFEVNMPSWGPWGNSFRMDPMMGIDARADRFRFNGMYADFNSDLFVRGQVDMQQSLNVNGTTTSNSFIKNEGTSSQFLKADGTVDANTYATTSIVDTKEDAINKSTDVNLGTSDTLFPTQNATKTYVDAKFAELEVVQGPAGEMGPQGVAGMDGATGPMGPIGDVGPKGDTGEQGPQGVAGMDGATGPMGPIGDVGPKGDTGEQGPQGEMGPQGPSGTPADLSEYATTSDLSSLESQMNNQYSYLQDQIYNNYYNDSQFHWLEYQIYNVREDVMNNQAQTQTALATKEDSINKSNDVNLGTSETLFPTQNATKTYVDAKIEVTTSSIDNLQNQMNNQYSYLQDQIYNNYYNDSQFHWLEYQIYNVREDVMNNQAQTQTALATKEDSINKSNDVNLGTSETLFPTQNATKTYVDAQIAAISTNTASVNEAADEFSAAVSQTSFILTQTPATTSKVKMYINGIRISNAAYSISGTTLTYDPAGNGNYSISDSDRVQFDYSF